MIQLNDKNAKHYFGKHPQRILNQIHDTVLQQQDEFNRIWKKILNELNELKPTLLEETEKLEQLRWLDYGYSIYVMNTDYKSISIDTPEDLQNIKKFIV